MSGVEFHGQSLLAVFAHPDDESLAAGGLLAGCAARGARVSLLCLSRGEAGRGASDLGAVRTRELHAAAQVLRLADLAVCDHADGMLRWLPEGVLEREIRDAITARRPDVVVTFGDDGLYWHPDHIATCEATRAAIEGLGPPTAPALFFVTMPPGQMRGVLDAVTPRLPEGARRDLLGIDNPDAFGAEAAPPTLVLRLGPIAARKLAAIQCHRTQVEGGPFDYLRPAEAEALIGVEHYHRAAVGSQVPAFIERLAEAPLETSPWT